MIKRISNAMLTYSESYPSLKKPTNRKRFGFSLLELVVVLAILVALGGIALRLNGMIQEDAKQIATKASLKEISKAIAEYWHDTKRIPFDGISTVAIESSRFHSRWLYFNPIDNSVVQSTTYPNTRQGWNGPYLTSSMDTYEIDLPGGFTSSYGNEGDPVVIDSFVGLSSAVNLRGNPIIIQDVTPGQSVREIRVVSAGPNGVIDIPSNALTSTLTQLDIGDDLYVSLVLR